MADLPWAVDAKPEDADALCAEELLRSECQALILLLDYSLAFPHDRTKQWRNALQSIDLRGPDSGASALARIRSEFETAKCEIGASIREASTHDRRPYERECREIERGLIVLDAVVEHAASCLRKHPEMRRVSVPEEP